MLRQEATAFFFITSPAALLDQHSPVQTKLEQHVPTICSSFFSQRRVLPKQQIPHNERLIGWLARVLCRLWPYCPEKSVLSGWLARLPQNKGACWAFGKSSQNKVAYQVVGKVSQRNEAADSVLSFRLGTPGRRRASMTFSARFAFRNLAGASNMWCQQCQSSALRLTAYHRPLPIPRLEPLPASRPLIKPSRKRM